MVVGPRQGEGDDVGRGADAAICDVDHHLFLHSLEVVIKFNFHGGKGLNQESCGFWCILTFATVALIQNEDNILGLGAMNVDDVAEVRLQRFLNVPQEALLASIW